MPRFSDEWLIDRVLFDYINGGTCSCCSLSSAIFLPGGTAELIGTVSDIDTDQVKAEVSALETHPWPKDLRDHVWASRVRLRQRLKKTINAYTTFWNQYSVEFEQWSYTNFTVVQRLLQLSRTDLLETLESKYGIHSAFKGVMEAIIEQVAYFDLTSYSADGRDESEIQFEKILKFSRFAGGFTIEVSKTSNDGSTNDASPTVVNNENLSIWLQRMKTLGGPTLLGRGSSSVSTRPNNMNDDEEGQFGKDDNDDVDGPIIQKNNTPAPSLSSKYNGPSFQPDRRLLRLIIAREWSDVLIERFKKDVLLDQQQ